MLNGSEKREVKYSNICVGRSEPKFMSIGKDKPVLKKWNVGGVVIIESYGFHQGAVVRDFRRVV